GEYLSFSIEDETGEIRISAYRAETRQIVEEKRVPALGDWVEAAGTLRVREDFLSLTINAPEQLKVTRAEPVERAIGSITPTDQYLRVRVRGEVDITYEPYEGLTLITVRDETGSIPVAVSEDMLALDGIPPPLLPKGQPVEIVAAVSLYGDTVQLVPASVADIAPLDQPVLVAAEREIGELTGEDAGQMVIVSGAVTKLEPFSAGVKFALEDISGQITVLLWQDVYDGLSDDARPEVGAEVQVQGELSEYRGELEVIPNMPDDVWLLAPPPKAAPPTEPPQPEGSEVEARTIGDVTSADVGQIVRLAGALGEMETFSAGVKFTLNDGSGTIILLLWQNVYDAIPDAERLVAGARIEVVGQIEEYRGELEIIPEAGGVEMME
ncbi:MAG: hypothetical protein U9R15_15515, partial [Chloroflexota bacterium]|nr:hypothetical protein [Chloroflexota bacterium]